MRTIQLTFAAAVLLIVGVWLYEVSDYLLVWSRRVAFLVGQGVRWGGLLLVVLVAFGCIAYLLRQRHEHMRQRDGAWAAEYQPLVVGPRRLWMWMCGKPAPKLRLDPNAHLGHALAIDAAGVHEFSPAAGWDRQAAYMADQERTNRVRAIAPGDAAISLPWFGGDVRAGIANAATGRLLAGAYDRTPRPAVTVERPAEPLQLPAPPPVDLPLSYAIERAETQAWPLGFNAEGDLAWFNPLLHAHVAIVGGTGTGKTTGVGYLLACHALRQGWHVIVFDADDGAAWTPFITQAECITTDTDAFGGQIASLHHEFERRQALLAERAVPDLNYLPGERRLLVVIEEYGDLSRTMRLRNPAAARVTEAQIDTLMRRGRKAGIHIALLDQYPEYWSNQLLANAKFRVVFQLGPNQGAKMEEYDAAKLPPLGAFLLRGQRYTAWHVAPHVRDLLADVPALSVEARIIGRDGGSFGRSAAGRGGESPEVEATEHPQPNALPNGPTDLQAAVWEWRDAHPHGTQAELRREFGRREIDIARGYAHECWHKWPGANNCIDLSTDEGRAAFAAMAASARLPNGAPLGTDITGGAA